MPPLLIALVVGAIALPVMFRKPMIYKAVVVDVEPERRQVYHFRGERAAVNPEAKVEVTVLSLTPLASAVLRAVDGTSVAMHRVDDKRFELPLKEFPTGVQVDLAPGEPIELAV